MSNIRDRIRVLNEALQDVRSWEQLAAQIILEAQLKAGTRASSSSSGPIDTRVEVSSLFPETLPPPKPDPAAYQAQGERLRRKWRESAFDNGSYTGSAGSIRTRNRIDLRLGLRVKVEGEKDHVIQENARLQAGRMASSLERAGIPVSTDQNRVLGSLDPQDLKRLLISKRASQEQPPRRFVVRRTG